jgi:RHS repeat-associated protein
MRAVCHGEFDCVFDAARLSANALFSLGAFVRHDDGKRVIEERDTNDVPTVAYTRGNDLSGQTGSALDGAGGIGGLLARSDSYSSGTFSDHNYYHADGNGNITYLVNSSQTLAASYRYDAYGNLLSSSGTLAGANTYRFSSKEWIPSASLYYYLYRFYSPSLQRWLNRDPIQELGGLNLYGFVLNNPISLMDNFGLAGFGDLHVCEAALPPPPPFIPCPPKPRGYNYICGWIYDPKSGRDCPNWCKKPNIGTTAWPAPPPVTPPPPPCAGTTSYGKCMTCMTENGANNSQADSYCYKKFGNRNE